MTCAYSRVYLDTAYFVCCIVRVVIRNGNPTAIKIQNYNDEQIRILRYRIEHHFHIC